DHGSLRSPRTVHTPRRPRGADLRQRRPDAPRIMVHCVRREPCTPGVGRVGPTYGNGGPTPADHGFAGRGHAPDAPRIMVHCVHREPCTPRVGPVGPTYGNGGPTPADHGSLRSPRTVHPASATWGRPTATAARRPRIMVP